MRSPFLYQYEETGRKNNGALVLTWDSGNSEEDWKKKKSEKNKQRKV